MYTIYRLASVVAVALLLATPSFGQGEVIFSEDFEGLELGDFVDEPNPPVGLDGAWTPDAPEGWSIETTIPSLDTGDPAGCTEWRGWSFANIIAWTNAAGGQRREEFSKGQGTVAIADPDEWDDCGEADELGRYFTFLTTPEIDITGAAEGSVVLTFDSSWRDEDTQDANLEVSFDGGSTFEELFYWASDPASPNFKDDVDPETSTNETVVLEIPNPADATGLIIKFGMLEATNDWWWAIDNIAVTSGDQTLFSEDFEGLELQEFVDEAPLPSIGEDVTGFWTSTPPEGWVQDNFFMEPIDPDNGVRDWFGWNFANVEAWAFVAGGQGRTDFTLGDGTVAIADPDEWDDKGDPIGFDATLLSPVIDISGLDTANMFLSFDSSWRPEGEQVADLFIGFDGADPSESSNFLFTWDSVEGGPTFKPDTRSERVSIQLDIPDGTSSVQFEWQLRGGNNWWWAIDDVVVTVGGEFTQVQEWQLF